MQTYVPATGSPVITVCALIARVLQEDWKVPIAPSGPLVQYPVRAVLGFADADRELVRDRLLRYLNR